MHSIHVTKGISWPPGSIDEIRLSSTRLHKWGHKYNNQSIIQLFYTYNIKLGFQCSPPSFGTLTHWDINYYFQGFTCSIDL